MSNHPPINTVTELPNEVGSCFIAAFVGLPAWLFIQSSPNISSDGLPHSKLHAREVGMPALSHVPE